MNRSELFETGRKAISEVLADTSGKDVAKGLLKNGPAKAAGAAVLTRALSFGVMPLAASFAAGAVVGAGALVLLAPGGDQIRAAVAEELTKWSARRRAGAQKEAGQKDTESKDASEDGSETERKRSGKSASARGSA